MTMFYTEPYIVTIGSFIDNKGSIDKPEIDGYKCHNGLRYRLRLVGNVNKGKSRD